MAAALMVIGLIGLLASLGIFALCAIFSSNNDGVLAAKLAKYPFYVYSLTFVGFCFQDDSFMEEFFSDPMMVTLVFLSFLPFCIVTVKLIKRVIKYIQQRRADKAEIIRQGEIAQIEESLRKHKQEYQELTYKMESRKRHMTLVQLLNDCGSDISGISSNTEMVRATRLSEEMARKNQIISELAQKLYELQR